jgi:hypothetical protein
MESKPRPSRLSRAFWLIALSLVALALACWESPDSVPTPTQGVTTEVGSLDTLSPVVQVEATTSAPAPTVTPPTLNKLGVHLLLDDGRNTWPIDLWPLHLRYARQAVGEWGYVTELVRVDDLNPDRWQYFLDLCADFHLTPVFRLATTYDQDAHWWTAPLPDGDGTYYTIAVQYASFIAALHWPTPEHYVVVGNEPNHGNEWSGRPDPAAYARFLIDVSTALLKADPDVRVLNAGFDPYTPHTGNFPFVDGLLYIDEETFLDQMHAAYPGVFTYLDIWASHSYPMGPLTEGPWQQSYQVDWINDAVNPDHTDPPPHICNRGINGYEWELFKLSTLGVSPLPVMITETGWRHAESTDLASTDNGRALPDATTVAWYLDLALYGNGGRYPDLPQEGWTPWLTDPRIIAVTPFALNGFPREWGHTNWLALDSNGKVLYSYPPFDLLATGSVQP